MILSPCSGCDSAVFDNHRVPISVMSYTASSRRSGLPGLSFCDSARTIHALKKQKTQTKVLVLPRYRYRSSQRHRPKSGYTIPSTYPHKTQRGYRAEYLGLSSSKQKRGRAFADSSLHVRCLLAAVHRRSGEVPYQPHDQNRLNCPL
jgi:hypothetical protein